METIQEQESRFEYVDPSLISKRIGLVMADIGAIGKDRENQSQKYNFRGVDDVLNAVSPACVKHGIRVQITIHDYYSEIRDFEDVYDGKVARKFQTRVTLRMRLEFIAPDGSSHVSEGMGEAMDYQGDKATNKAMSAAFKYACFLGLVIPVQGVLDESEEDEKLPSEQDNAKQQQPNSIVPIQDRVSKLMAAFQTVEVDEGMIEARLGHKISAITPREIDNLRIVYNRIKKGEAKREIYFNPDAGTLKLEPTDENS